MPGPKFDKYSKESHSKLTEEGKNLSRFQMESVYPQVFRWLKDPEWRLEMLERVDQLIEQIDENGIEELIFLDKSARPISWLLRERLNHKYPQLKKPPMKYVNFGTREYKGPKTIMEEISEETDAVYSQLSKEERETLYADDGWFWKKFSFAEGSDEDGDIWMSKKNIPPIWAQKVQEKQELIEMIHRRYGNTLGKKVLVIDDLLFSGETLKGAVAIFIEAYPQTEVFGVHFFKQKHKKPDYQIPWFKKAHLIGIEEEGNKLNVNKYSSVDPKLPNLSKELRAIMKEIAQTDIDKLREEVSGMMDSTSS